MGAAPITFWHKISGVLVDITLRQFVFYRYLASLRAVPGRERRAWPEAKETEEGLDQWRPKKLDMDTSFG